MNEIERMAVKERMEKNGKYKRDGRDGRKENGRNRMEGKRSDDPELRGRK